MDKLKLVIAVVLVIIIGLVGRMVLKSKSDTINKEPDYSWHEGEVSPLIDPVDMVNTKGQHVEKKIKGTFREIGTGRIFESGGLGSCVEDGCKRIYFIDCSYQGVRSDSPLACYGFSDKDNPHITTIISKKFYSSDGIRHKTISSTTPLTVPDDKIIYTIKYNGKELIFEQELCVGGFYRDGGYQCENESLKVGDKIYFTLDSAGKIKSTLPIYGAATVADLISYQYFTFPDTGEKYPVVTVQE